MKAVAADRFEISFAASSFCDATVAVEDGQGRIVRHLASGVLGRNAPEPLQKETLVQTIVWDGKDDQGRYLDSRTGANVRVSLGLKPLFERSLFWDPRKRLSAASPLIAAAQEGVYVFDGDVVDALRLYDHEGNYLRTLYPFAGDKLASFGDLHWHVFPQDGARLPLKEGEHQATLLSSGDNAGFREFGVGPKHQRGSGASALAAGAGRVALAKLSVNRLAADGSSGGASLKGPRTSFTVISRALPWRGGGRPVEAVPTSAAISPDGQWLYLAGYTWLDNMGTGGMAVRWLHGVTRVRLTGDEPVEVFAGSMKDRESGSGNDRFNVPTSVACDRDGRVYVADHLNDRIQVFQSDGKLVRSIAIARPTLLAIHHRTQDIYVFSWMVKDYDALGRKAPPVRATLTHFGPLDRPDARATWPLSLEDYIAEAGHGDPWGGLQYRAAVDSWTDPPTVWLVPGTPLQGNWDKAGIRLLVEKDGKLLVKRDFGQEVRRSVFRGAPPSNLRQRLYANPRSGDLYVAEGDAGVGKSVGQLLRIGPDSGMVQPIELPFDAEDFAFDPDGLIYLRALTEVVRYDPASWREVPLDYGEERTNVGFASSKAEGAGKRNSPAASGLILPVQRYNHHGGMMVSVRGRLAAGIHGGQEPAEDRRETGVALAAGKGYAFRLFPGRATDGLVLVFDRHGQLVHDDAIPGLAFTHGVGIDKDDNLYVMAMACRVLDGRRYHNEATDTLIKFRPGKGRVLCTGKAPVPLPQEERPKRPADLSARSGGRLQTAWVEGAEWFYGGVGFHARHGEAEGYGCDCFNSRFDLDYFARSFVPEVDHYSVAVLDSAGNLICRIGRYGNVDDGLPPVAGGWPAKPRSIGGDEVALFHPCYVAVQTDRRLFIADAGNQRIVGVRLDYHATERVPLK